MILLVVLLYVLAGLVLVTVIGGKAHPLANFINVIQVITLIWAAVYITGTL